MKLYSFSPLFTALAFGAGLAVTAVADTVTLKNGTVLNGSIVKDNADSIVIETKEKGITDEVTVKKADIAKTTKETAEDKAANDLLAKLNPSKDNLAAADYEKLIKSEIQPWLDKNKAGGKRKEIEDLLKIYTEEMAKAKAGDIKLRGAWVTVEEKKWNEYNVNARKLRLKIEEQLKAKKYPEAYWLFAEMEATGQAGVDFPPVVDQMKKVMPQLEGAISNAIAAQTDLLKQRTTLLASMAADQKANEIKRIADEKKELTTRVSLQKKNKNRIVEWNPYDLKTIQEAQTAVKKEVEYLNKLPLPDMISANKKFEAGLKDLHTRSWLSAKSNFEAAMKVYPKDVTVKAKYDEAVKGASAPAPKPGSTPAPGVAPAKPPGVK